MPAGTTASSSAVCPWLPRALASSCPWGRCVSSLTCPRKLGVGSFPADLPRGWRKDLGHERQRQQYLGVLWIDGPLWGLQRSCGWDSHRVGGGASGTLTRGTLGPPMTRLYWGWGRAPSLFFHTFIKYFKYFWGV